MFVDVVVIVVVVGLFWYFNGIMNWNLLQCCKRCCWVNFSCSDFFSSLVNVLINTKFGTGVHKRKTLKFTSYMHTAGWLPPNPEHNCLTWRSFILCLYLCRWPPPSSFVCGCSLCRSAVLLSLFLSLSFFRDVYIHIAYIYIYTYIRVFSLAWQKNIYAQLYVHMHTMMCELLFMS